MTIAVHCPVADWNRARLLTASPSPPLRANGASSATMWTTRTAVPSEVLSGPVETGIAAEYGTWLSDAIGSPCEAATAPPRSLRDAGSDCVDHTVGEQVDLIHRRVDVGRDSHPVELVVVHRCGDDVVLRQEPSAELAHVEPFDVEDADGATHGRTDRGDHLHTVARREQP